MKSWRWIMLFLGAGVLAATACSSSSDDDDDDGTATGTQTGTTQTGTTQTGTTQTGTTQTGTTQTGTTQTGGTGCDVGDCTTCVNSDCAQLQACATQTQTCGENAACPALLTCLQGCDSGDTACEDECLTTHSAGVDDLNAWLDCLFCTACYVDCDGASMGCP